MVYLLYYAQWLWGINEPTIVVMIMPNALGGAAGTQDNLNDDGRRVRALIGFGERLTFYGGDDERLEF